jgi:hypothetical protein
VPASFLLEDREAVFWAPPSKYLEFREPDS